MSDVTGRLSSALAGRYRIERHLGEGGMATVYLAEDLKHDRKVAVKVLRPDLAAVVGGDRFLAEIKTTASLQHPHILPLFDSGEADSFLYYVMPYVSGETLRDRITREKQLSVEDAVEVTKAVASALDYAHRQSVIHRDIKPENVLLHDGQPVVADFGIALAVSTAAGTRITETGLSLGTPSYMSPEQAMADRELTGRSDIYALGCMAYEMLVGDPPHTGSTAQAIVAKILSEEPRRITASRATVPPHVETAIHKALQKIPADRFASASEFAAALSGTAATAASTSPVMPVATPGASRKSSSRIYAAIGAAAAVVIAAGVWWIGAGSDGVAPGPAVGAADGPPSVAVLPFTDPTASGDEQYFGDGVAETLTNALNKVDGLRVAAQTSAFALRGDDVDLASIGQQLNVGTVLRGNIQRAAGRLRVTVRLESTADGSQLWSEQYDEEAADVFAIQDAIARAVVGELQVTLLSAADDPIVQAGTDNLEAYNLYLQGRYAWAQRGDGLRRSLELFEQALALDPFYAQAHAGIADANMLLGLYAYADPGVVIPRGRAAAERALSLDPSLAEAHATLGYIEWVMGWNLEAAKAHFEQAIALDSTYAPAHYWYGQLMAYGRDRDSALAEATRATTVDPLAAQAAHSLAAVYSVVGQTAAAVGAARRAVQLSPSWSNYWRLALTLAHAGRGGEALVMADSAITLSDRNPLSLYALARAHMASGDTAGVHSVRDEWIRQSESRYVYPTVIGLAQSWLGEEDAAAWFERALAERDPLLIFFAGGVYWGSADAPDAAQLDGYWERMVGR